MIIAVFPCSLLAGEEPSIAGHWEGAIGLPGTKLDVNIDFTLKEDGSWTGDISIPGQNAKGLPREVASRFTPPFNYDTKRDDSIFNPMRKDL